MYMIKLRVIKIFDIHFLDTDFENIKNLFQNGILIVFPAAPALINIFKDKEYHKSLKSADFALFDSGYLCLLLKLLKGVYVKKFSGLKFLKSFFLNFDNNDKLFLINPDKFNSIKNTEYLKSIKINNIYNYVAPIYKDEKVEDKNILLKLNQLKPMYVLINLGGGVQEKLGFYLKKKLDYKPNIICTGAAIAFLTKQQAYIPSFIDKFYLGWFFRILFSPKVYFKRYFKSFKLFKIILNTNIKVL